jgi:hypothetical protein
MKKTMLWSALFTLICTQIQAEVTQLPTQSQTPGAASAPTTNDKTNQMPVVIQQTASKTPAADGLQQNQAPTQTQSIDQQPAQNVQNSQQNQPAQQTATVQPQAAPIINCDYKIPAETKTIEQSLVLSWSEKAANQAFDFNPATVDSQIQKLKSCFTDQGWIGFSSALEKSGNLEAIKTQKLTVSSQIDGQPQITEAKDNQWKITLPLQVVYQNDKEKVTQLLNVNLNIGRKTTGDLGIVQMIATPRTAVTTQQATPNAANATDTNKPASPSDSTNTSPTTPTATTTPSTPTNTGLSPNSTETPITEPQKPSTDSSPANNPGSPN